jgi:hypothetical protein
VTNSNEPIIETGRILAEAIRNEDNDAYSLYEMRSSRLNPDEKLLAYFASKMLMGKSFVVAEGRIPPRYYEIAEILGASAVCCDPWLVDTHGATTVRFDPPGETFEPIGDAANRVIDMLSRRRS